MVNFVVPLSLLAVFCNAYTPELTLYKELDFSGDSFTTRSKHADFIKQAPEVISNSKSYCIRGWWGFYSQVKYEGKRGITLSGHPDLRCVDNISLNPSFLSSVRYLGSEDTENPSISIYSKEFNVGSEIVIDGFGIASLDFKPLSLVTIGFSNWTFYSGANFQGNGTCYTTGSEYYHELWVLNSTLSETQSIIRGCW